MQSDHHVEKRAGSRIRNRPDGQGLEPYKLPLVMGVAVTGWIAWFGWGLEFDKGARRLTGAFESDVGPSHAWRGELGNDDKLVCGNMGEQGFEKALKRWSKSLFEIARPARRNSRMRSAYSMIDSTTIAPS